jgi:hypothetical protein
MMKDIETYLILDILKKIKNKKGLIIFKEYRIIKRYLGM